MTERTGAGIFFTSRNARPLDGLNRRLRRLHCHAYSVRFRNDPLSGYDASILTPNGTLYWCRFLDKDVRPILVPYGTYFTAYRVHILTLRLDLDLTKTLPRSRRLVRCLTGETQVQRRVLPLPGDANVTHYFTCGLSKPALSRRTTRYYAITI